MNRKRTEDRCYGTFRCEREEFMSFCNEFPFYAWRNHPPLRSKEEGGWPLASAIGGTKVEKLINSSPGDGPLTQNVVTPTGADIDATSCAYECGHDGKPCEVVELFKNALLEDIARERGVENEPVTEWSTSRARERFMKLVDAVSDQLPCESCRAAEKAIARLSGVRLGKHERRILLDAPSNGQWRIIEPDGESRSAAEANRRAVRKLHSAGLLHLSWRGVEMLTMQYACGVPVRRMYRRNAVRLSPLGAAVVDRLKEILQEGRRIRWADHQAALIAMVRKQPEELLHTFRARLAETAKQVSEFAAMLRRVNPKGAHREDDRAEALGLVLGAVSRVEDTEVRGSLACLTDCLTEGKTHG